MKIIPILLFAASIASSQAATNILYSCTGNFAGTLNGASFNAPVRISMLSNPENNTSSSVLVGITTTTTYRLFGDIHFDIGNDGLDVVTMTGLSPVWTTPMIHASRSTTIGIYSTTVSIAYFNPVNSSNDKRTFLGTKSGSSYDFSGPESYTFTSNPTNFSSIETNGGTLLFSSGGPVNFTATAVPEPSAAALLGRGAFGLVARRKR